MRDQYLAIPNSQFHLDSETKMIHSLIKKMKQVEHHMISAFIMHTMKPPEYANEAAEQIIFTRPQTQKAAV